MTLTPHQRRDWLVENHLRTAKALGLDVDAEAVAREAARDLAAADKLADEAVKVRAPAAPDPELERKRLNVVNDEARKRKAQVYERPAPAGDRLLPVLGGVDEEKRIAMFVRIERICRPKPDPVTKEDLANGLGCVSEYPALANDIALHTYGYARGGTIHTSTGVTSYKGLSFEDKIRKYTRALEDICDRSTALLGPWWVK